MAGAYGNSFGEVWRNAFARDQARDASVSQSTDRLIQVLQANQARKMAQQQMAMREAAVAQEQALRRDMFANDLARQSQAASQWERNFAFDQKAKEEANRIAAQRLAIEDMNAQFRANQPSATELKIAQDQQEMAAINAERFKGASALANLLNRKQELMTGLEKAPGVKGINSVTGEPIISDTEESLTNKYDTWNTWRSNAKKRAQEEIAARDKAVGPLVRERLTLDQMIDNLMRGGAAELIERAPDGRWVPAGAPGSAAFVGPTAQPAPPPQAVAPPFTMPQTNVAPRRFTFDPVTGQLLQR